MHYVPVLRNSEFLWHFLIFQEVLRPNKRFVHLLKRQPDCPVEGRQ